MASHPETLQQKIQSLQHSLLFLQEQHASTLKGLHEEVAKLQNKCAALTHQLAASSPITAETDGDSESSLKETLKSELKDSRIEQMKLKESLEMKEQRILRLEAQSKNKEQKYLNELKQYQRKVSELQNELEHKAASIAYLTTKIQQSKLKDNLLSSDGVNPKGISLCPTRPNGKPGRQNERKNIRSPVNSPAANVGGLVFESNARLSSSDHVLQNSLPRNNSTRHPARFRHSKSDPPRPSVGRSQIQRDRDMILINRPKPSDYEDFIKINQSEDIVAKPSIEPLPPITPRSGKQLRQSRIKSRENNDNHLNCAGEVETIIVEKTLSSDHSYGKLQDLS